jgi:hypothetical protein
MICPRCHSPSFTSLSLPGRRCRTVAVCARCRSYNDGPSSARPEEIYVRHYVLGGLI